MLGDMGYLPGRFQGDYQEFFGDPGDSGTFTMWKTWRKPRNTHMHLFVGASAGGGGGGGHSAAAGAARGGGGGGQSGCMFSLLVPTFHIPDILYININRPGLGGAATAAGAASSGTYLIAVRPHTTEIVSNQLLRIINSNGTNAGAGTGATGGAAGTAPTVQANTSAPLGILCQTVTIAGQAGAAGGAQTGAIGGAIAFATTGLRVMGAPGGAGVTAADFAGGIITAITDSLLSDMRPQGAAAGSNNGSAGYLIRKPYGFWSYPGLGGSSSNTGVGGDGGNGGPGSGGGGGGGGTTGGRGGNGGVGFLMVYSW